MNFREELQLNVRRLGSPGVNGKHMKTNSRASPTASTGGDASGRGTPQSPATSRPAVPSEVDEPEDEMPATPYSNVPVTVVSSTSQSLNPVEAFSRSGTPQSPRVPTPQTPAPIVAGADQKRLDMLPMTSAYADPVDLSTSKNPSGPFERSILLTSANQLSLIQSVGLTAGGTEMGQFTLPDGGGGEEWHRLHPQCPTAR
ncbi:hypothetical protein AGDE_13924 [Angomonas deanei]|uniref:Uncharacterized protein n=1 Tax=Angomonas deanei TaxID=59799 RepID=A0A7G2CM30_9TRYP|nr:hypothetical protein AGDE_13924 [Angomonas deanei]CAD2220898.1 hypothetical protein, conserved [Angomonas deanei]|eukprot:EPY21634.1 hypothetical protein AGDE_13924 [Angomonas deanei]